MSASVTIKLNGIPQTVIFDTALQVYSATLPTVVADYTVEVDSVDAALTTVALITFVQTTNGEIVKFSILSSGVNPVGQVVVTAIHRNPIDGADNGQADTQETDADGVAYLNLGAGAYNLKIEKVGLSTKIVKNFQVLVGISVFNATGDVPHVHIVRDNDGVEIEDVMVKIEDMTLAPGTRLIANRKTDLSGAWDAMLPQDRPLVFTFEKAGFDFKKVGVQSA